MKHGSVKAQKGTDKLIYLNLQMEITGLNCTHETLFLV